MRPFAAIVGFFYKDLLLTARRAQVLLPQYLLRDAAQRIRQREPDGCCPGEASVCADWTIVVGSGKSVGSDFSLGQHADFSAFDERQIYMGAEAGFGRSMDETVAVYRDVVDKSVFLHCIRQ
jgi:hypothetical protein